MKRLLALLALCLPLSVAAQTSTIIQLDNATVADLTDDVQFWAADSTGTPWDKGVLFSRLLSAITESDGDFTIRILDSASVDTQAELEALLTDATNILDSAEVDTETEIEAILQGSVNIIVATEIDASSEIAAIVGDETGTGALVFGTSPTIATPVLTLSTSAGSSEGQIRWGDTGDLLFIHNGASEDIFYPVGAGDNAELCRLDTAGNEIDCDVDVSSEIAGALTDETGSGALVFGTSPTIATPTLTLKQGTTPTPTAEGDMQWDTDNDQIVIGDGAAQATFAPYFSLTDGNLCTWSDASAGFVCGTNTAAELETALGGANVLLETEIDASSELLALMDDETGTGALVFGTSPTIATPVVTGKVDRNNVSVDDDDCTGDQGNWWYDTGDAQFEFCNANGGTPVTLPTTSMAFSGLTGGTNTSAAMVVGTGASLSTSGTGTIVATGGGADFLKNADYGDISAASTVLSIDTDVDLDFSGLTVADSLEVPNGTTAIGADCDEAAEAGRLFVDTDAADGETLYVCKGVSGWQLQTADDITDNTIAELSDVDNKQGTGALVQMFTGTASNGDFACYDASGNVTGSASACSGAAGDDVKVNGSDATGVNFRDSLGVSFTLKTSTDPDQISAQVDSLDGPKPIRLNGASMSVTKYNVTPNGDDDHLCDLSLSNICDVTLVSNSEIDSLFLTGTHGNIGDIAFTVIVRQPSSPDDTVGLRFDATMFEGTPGVLKDENTVTYISGIFRAGDGPSGLAKINSDEEGVTSSDIQDGTIVNADINASADIATSKLATEVRSMYWPAGAMSTDGAQCEDPREVTINSGPKRYIFNCTDNASSLFYFDTIMPDSWDAGTFTIELAAMDSTASPSQVLDIDFSAQCRGDSDVVNSTWGTAQNAAITFDTQYDEEHATTAAITANGTCAAGDHLYVRGDIDDAGGNTSTANWILGVKLEYTSDIGD